MDAMQTKQAAEEAQKKWMRRMGMITGPSANFLARGFGSLAAKIEKETTFLVTHMTGAQTLKRLQEKGRIVQLTNYDINSKDLAYVLDQYDARFGKGARRELVVVMMDEGREGMKQRDIKSGVKVGMSRFFASRKKFNEGTKVRIYVSGKDLDRRTGGHGKRERAEFSADCRESLDMMETMRKNGLKSVEEYRDFMKEQGVDVDRKKKKEEKQVRDKEAIREMRSQSPDDYRQFNLHEIGARYKDIDGKDVGTVPEAKFAKAHPEKVTIMTLSPEDFIHYGSPVLMKGGIDASARGENGSVTVIMQTKDIGRFTEEMRKEMLADGVEFTPESVKSYMGPRDVELSKSYADNAEDNLHHVGDMEMKDWIDFASKEQLSDISMRMVAQEDPETGRMRIYSNKEMLAEDIEPLKKSQGMHSKEDDEKTVYESSLKMQDTVELTADDLRADMAAKRINAIALGTKADVNMAFRDAGEEFRSMRADSTGMLETDERQFRILQKSCERHNVLLSIPEGIKGRMRIMFVEGNPKALKKDRSRDNGRSEKDHSREMERELYRKAA